MNAKLKILHIEDSPPDAELIQRCLKKSGLDCEVKVVETKKEYLAALENFFPDVVLSDHSLLSFNSLEALTIAKNYKSDIPFILVSGVVSEEFAVEIIKAGADDYILKSSLMRLPSAIITSAS